MPYNTGSKDWKYNNNYVDVIDSWRHSKWLSMMKKRLKLAKRILNPDDSILIVTIDEKEYLHLGLLLNQVFPERKIQMTTIVINPKGTARYNEFSRVEEYAFFVFIGKIQLQSFGSDMLTERNYAAETHVRWRGLARTGRKGLRSNNPGSWYPIFLNESDLSIHSIGDAIGKDEVESSVQVPIGTFAVWPPTKNGQQYSWSTVPETLRSIYSKGGFKTGRIDHQKRAYPFYYLSSGSFDKIAKGEILITGKGPSNELIVQFAEGLKSAAPRGVWNKVTHDAGSHGTGLLQQIIPGGKFPFPKSLYAVRDSIKFFVANKPKALVVDFFAGSGTTLNAVNLLNATDNGNRQCILVTNNEVSADEAKVLQEQGFMPGAAEYEKHGICQSVTWPRSKYTILGKRDDGTLLEGDYLTGLTITKDKRRTFKQIGFIDSQQLTAARKKEFVNLLDGIPQTKIDKDATFFVDDDCKASVLFNDTEADAYLDALEDMTHIETFYLITANNALFKRLKDSINELLGPLKISEEEKRPMSAGFEANLAYFKLNFLDADEVQLGRKFAALLPILWLMAGAIGPCPNSPDNVPYFLPEHSPFAVLLDEHCFLAFKTALQARTDISHVFLVTHSEDGFFAMRDELAGHLQVIQLYKNYLDQFKINTKRERT